MKFNEQKLHTLLGKVVSDFGAVFQAPLILIGDSLGLYRAMRDGQPTTPAALAERTDTAERYVREWLNAHAAAGYVDYHTENGTYSLSPEQSMLFAEEGSPAFIVGAFQAATGALTAAQTIQLTPSTANTTAAGSTTWTTTRAIWRSQRVRQVVSCSTHSR